jgi:serine/threonine-protein kinase
VTSRPSDLQAHLQSALADRYRIESELGAGGMALVFRATDLKHGRAVAIKVLRPELALVVGAERFAREITTTATLRHPHILPLFDSGEANGALFYVMPLVDGESLRDRLNREKRLPIDDALRIAREVADALGYAHERGIAHRDIKPENILLEGGHAVVADFGIARTVASSDTNRITQTGFAVGTPAYMSPEQAVGDTTVDGRSDLYSLACVLYEMLAGVPPFSGATAAAVTSQHLVADPPAVTDARPDTPVTVSGAIRLAMAKDPAARPFPAARFVESLSSADSAAASSPALTRPRRRVTPARVALASIAIVAALAIGWQLSRRTNGASTIQRIAVLPMANETGDSTQQFFADGMTREVISTLTDAGVHVLGYRAVVPYRGSTTPLPDIARALGVDAIVSGSIVKVGAAVRLAAELIDAKNEELWSRSFERPAADVLALQRDVAGDIARGIRMRLTPEQEKLLGTTRQVDPRAYAQFLLGQDAASLRTADGFQRSVTHLRRSLAIDSTYAPAWATLAITNAYALI